MSEITRITLDMLLLNLDKMPEWFVVGPWRIAIICIAWFFYGASICSGVFCLSHRIKHESSWKSWIRKRSYCDHCHSTLEWWKVIPVIGAFMCKGKCEKCGYKFGYRYAIIEALCGLSLLALIWFT